VATFRGKRIPRWLTVTLIVLAVVVLIVVIALARVVMTVRDPAAVIREDRLTNADIWDTEPRMMAAGLGFTNIIGVPGLSTDDIDGSRTRVRLAGGAWNVPNCAVGTVPDLVSYTSAATPEAVKTTYGELVYYSDGLPIEFSWPVLPSTVHADDFQVNLNDGTSVQPQVAAAWPNFEYNERSTVVIFGHFGNRIDPNEPGAIFPTSVEVVQGETTLELVGVDKQRVSAVGMRAESGGSPYTDPNVPPKGRGGPQLAAAKLSIYTSEGDAGPALFSPGLLPNHGEALYGHRAQFRLRVFTTGGMTADGVRGLWPTEFERFFRVVAEDDEGVEVLITESGLDYEINGGTLRVEGLADLGIKQDSYDDCYHEDKDNQIDIILSGDESAVKAITRVQMPSTGHYSPVYNPGGPGNDPMPGLRYTAPSPPIDIQVLMAIDDPLVVTYP
jgi:hypothetical protein